MSDSFNFREFRELNKKFETYPRGLSPFREKERDDLRLKKAMENYFNAK